MQAACLTVYRWIADSGQKPSLLWLRTKRVVLQDQADSKCDIFFPASKGSIIPFSASVVMEMPYRLCLQLCWVEIRFSFMTAKGALMCVQVKRHRTRDRVTGQLWEVFCLWI